MREISIKKWCELPPVWKELYDGNKAAAPFQSYEFLTFTGKGKPQRNDPLRLIGLKELNLVLYSDKKAIAIAPLLIKKKNKKYTVYFRGHFTTANDLDFIYKEWTYEDFQFLMDGIRNTLVDMSFFLDRITETSPSCEYLKRYLASGNIEEHECFSIPVPADYEDWHKSLHKSVRRNLVSYNNRVKRDNIKLSARYYCNESVDEATYKKMACIYADRFLIKNNYNFGKLTFLVRKMLVAILEKDKMSRWLNLEGNFHTVVYFDNEIAALTSGFICKDKRVLLSRLAINTKYAKYGPGGLLISSLVAYFAEQKKTGNLDIERLDLSQEGHGGMSYKQAYGGEVYYKYTFMG